MFLERGRKPEYPRKTRAGTGRTCKFHTRRPEPGSNPASLRREADVRTDFRYRLSSGVNSSHKSYVVEQHASFPFRCSAEQGFCSSPWIPYNGHCFHLVRTPKTWSDAQKECRKEEGELVSMRNLEDHSFVISQLGYGERTPNLVLWIGLNDRRTEGLFEWSDAVNFLHWQEGEPNNFQNSESCAEFRMYRADDAGSWNDVHCESYNDWLCEIRAGNQCARMIAWLSTDRV
uniref:C-type lectin domain-containing protein n=1 Tax=Hippocampus comes TaxID=109280 RepID=A0A3Q2XJL3_HIPCM